MKVEKINESWSKIYGSISELRAIFEFLKVEREGAYFDPLVKRGFKSAYDYFSKLSKDKSFLLVMNGHLNLLNSFGIKLEINEPAFKPLDVQGYLKKVIEELPFKPYDYQLRIVFDAFQREKGVFKSCTGSGKSLSISLIIDFLVKHNKKVLLLVPNINLLTQFKSDIKSYNLIDLYSKTDLLGGGNICEFEKPLLISTWQSLKKYKDKFTSDKMNWDCIICDECHRFSSDETSEIVAATVNTKFRLGFTGTVPDNQTAFYTLLGLFGDVKTYIRAYELIDRGLGTPININTIIFNYNDEFKKLLRDSKNYTQQLKLVKEHESRNNFIENLSIKLMSKGDNNLVLYSHTEHGKTLFLDIVSKLFPSLKVENKDITGKKSFEFQEKIGVYFINGEDDAKTREKTRKVLEETYVEFDYNGKHYRINEREFVFNKDECLNFKRSGSILISNYAILSTGVNIKQLHNMILASPLKSYTTITQSIGRGMRIHETKSIFNVFDLVDNLGVRKPSGVFYKQYQHRVATSYNPEGYRIVERVVSL